jgi:hypothetical protein
MPSVVDPLTPDQQWLVDLVADAFLLDGAWPFFDYLEGRFDHVHKDAWAALYGLPRIGRWSYGPAWWVGINVPSMRPSPEVEIELTVLGMHHSASMKDLVPVFFRTLEVMIERRRMGPIERRSSRDVSVSGSDLNDWSGRAVPLENSMIAVVPVLLAREPGTWGNGIAVAHDGTWEKSIPRSVFDYEGVSSIESYVDRIEALTTEPVQRAAEAISSPLDIVAALDYLDTGWRVLNTEPLLKYSSAERTAKLTYPANTPEEFDSRLSALGEVLRSANAGARQAASRKLTGATHETPLAPLRDFMIGVAPEAEARIANAIEVLEAAVSIRDAAQHTEASARAVVALTVLGLDHPIGDPGHSWQVVSSRVITALNTLREVLATTPSA